MTQLQQTTSAPPSISAPSWAVRGYLDEHRAELAGLLRAPRSAGMLFARRHAEIMDGLLAQLHAGAAARLPEVRLDSFALAAVGGYGRQLLGCKSDLDVRFITDGSPDKLRSFVEAMLYPLWDAGVSIGHQVVSLSEAVEAARHDLPTATALLDLRPLVGNAALVRKLSERASAALWSESRLPAFLAELERHAQVRYERFGDSVYLLEPDVKNGTGGVRDLDLALWAARARFHTSDLRKLEALGVVTGGQVEEILLACDFLWAVRNHLHERAGRRCDRLTFGEQESLAGLMGYATRIGAAPGASATQLLGATVEAFMSDYYRHARAITRVRDQIIGRAKRRERRIRPREVDLGQGLLRCEGGVGLRNPAELASDPALALRMYAMAVARDMPVLAHSREAVLRATNDESFGAALRASAEASALFVSLVATCRQTRFRNGSILAELHDVGLLVAMLPEFAPVVGRVHHDMYHVYTVDVHSVAAVDRLRALSRGDFVAEQPLACRLAAEVARPQPLFMATLLHDIGKAIGGHDHARRGAEMARPILTRLGFSPDDVDDACHLVDKHLVMYLVAVQRDLADPATVKEFVREVRGREGLRDLFLLTVADLSTTSPTSMTKWKAGMLDTLMRASDALLSGQTGEEPSRAARVRDQVKRSWTQPGDHGFIDEFLATMPERYLMSNTPAEIAAHASVAQQRPGETVTAKLVPSRHPDVAELCVVTDGRADTELCVVAADRPGLLASITAAISANRLEIHAAQINSRTRPDGGVQAVDVFWVRSAARGAEGVAERLPKLERDLRGVIAGQLQPSELLKQPEVSNRSARAVPTVFTEIVIDDRASAQHTIIEVLTADRHALLFTLAQALHELAITIHVAKINTEGSRVIDVFYVTETDGRKLQPGTRTEEVRARLQAALGQPAGQALPAS
ncbi:MAG TPA: [protein-PII] uridylyltransferase [Polyangiales bacterium]